MHIHEATIAMTGDETGRRFYEEVLQGLTASPKYLSSKYFYDAAGDELFRHIMHCPEYYLTGCEEEILSQQSTEIACLLKAHADMFDVVELGPGDASKSIYLLKELLTEGVGYTYIPIDISPGVISMLEKELPEKLPQLRMHGLNGEYFDMLGKINDDSGRKKVVLFLGANIGNFTPEAARQFCRQVLHYLHPGDLLLVGFDLKKDPRVIRNAYNDKQGFTKAFNLNLLRRINRELTADFDIAQFGHYPVYDPSTGACKSYLISLSDQQVCIGQKERINFCEYETVFMEISQKYSKRETDLLAMQSGFDPLAKFFDSKKWFVDCLWQYP